MNCSFTPQGGWYVFDEDTGQTLKRGFRTKILAVAWMAGQQRGAQ